MVVLGAISSMNNLGLTNFPPTKNYVSFAMGQRLKILPFDGTSRSVSGIGKWVSFIRKRKEAGGVGVVKSVGFDVIITSDDEEEMSEGFFEAIEELERMAREPSDVLEEMNERLSAREMQLVLVYFAQEGRDSWFTLEVFEWLKKENRVDKDTMELMVSIMCSWLKKLIEANNKVEDVVDLLLEMDCIGLKTSFSMIEKVISLYLESGDREKAILFVKEVMRRGKSCLEQDEGNKGGPVGYLAWKMMEEGSYVDAAKLVIHLRECGLKPDTYSYLIAMTAILKELNEFGKALRKLRSFKKEGLVSELDANDVWRTEKYQQDLLNDGLLISTWVLEEGGLAFRAVVHKRLLAMYVCAGRGVEAERQLWEMKLLGKEADGDLYDIVMAICASQKESGSVARLLTRIDAASSNSKRKTLSWLLRGYVKGGHYQNAAEIVMKMLEFGLCPKFTDRVAVLQGLSSRIQQSGIMDTYISLCKRLADVELITPSIIYLHLKKHNLWVMKMI